MVTARDTLTGVLVFQAGLALILTLALGWGSYEYYERPFLRLKSRFERVQTEGAGAVVIDDTHASGNGGRQGQI
jgi:peptidoglycan/LPS O-acetylase OafA/YrhL